jgi:hypothetical protein
VKRNSLYILLLLSVALLFMGSTLWPQTRLSLVTMEETLCYDFNDGMLQGWTPGINTVISFGEVKMAAGSSASLSRVFDFSWAESVVISWRYKIASAYLGFYIDEVTTVQLTTPVNTWTAASYDITGFVKGKTVKLEFKPYAGSGYLYLDDITLYIIIKPELRLTAQVNAAGYPYDEVTVPVTATDGMGRPVANLLVQYEIQVGDWYRANTLLTDSQGRITINEKGKSPGVGTLTLTAIYGGVRTERSYELVLKSYLVATLAAETIQYYNSPVKVTIQVRDSTGAAVDPENMVIEATLAGFSVSGQLTKREVGAYDWSLDARQPGRLTVKVTPQKYGFFLKPGVVDVDVRQPSVGWDHDVPENVDLGSTLNLIFKAYSPQKELMDPAEVTATLRDPFDVPQQVRLSRISVGVYGFTYTFSREGLYYLTLEAASPRFEASTLKLSINVRSPIATPVVDVVGGLLLSPVTLALISVGIIFAVWGFWKGRR